MHVLVSACLRKFGSWFGAHFRMKKSCSQCQQTYIGFHTVSTHISINEAHATSASYVARVVLQAALSLEAVCFTCARRCMEGAKVYCVTRLKFKRPFPNFQDFKINSHGTPQLIDAIEIIMISILKIILYFVVDYVLQHSLRLWSS